MSGLVVFVGFGLAAILFVAWCVSAIVWLVAQN
jgi:hypothetical protein